MATHTTDTDAARERQYNNRAAVPEHPEIFADWESRSASLRRSRTCHLDLAYGPGPRETLDFFPADDGQAPLHVFIHGGYWQAMDKRFFSFVAEHLLQSGVAVAVLNYPLCPDAALHEITSSVRRACAWLWEHGPRLGADRERFQICGHSAGGHLTAMLMATDWPSIAPDAPRSLVKSGIAISGLFELEPLRHTSINRALRLEPESARAQSPRYLAPTAPGPLVLAVGALESDEYHRQSEEFASAWQAQGVDVRMLELPARNHFTVLEDLCAPHGVLVKSAKCLLGV